TKLSDVRVSANLSGKEDVERHQDSKRTDIEDAFDGPNSQLGGEGDILLSRDQVRPNELARSSQQRQPGETYECRRHEAAGASLAYGLEENLPAKRTENVRDVNQTDRSRDMEQVDVAGLPEFPPVKRAPMLDLEVDQQAENGQHDSCAQKALLIHLGLRSGTNTQPK